MLNTLTLSLLLLALTQADAGACTREYMPVCGQLPDKTKTFPNRCLMNKAGAVFLSEGECKPKPLTIDVTLKVAPKLIDKPSADGSSARYTLLRELSRTPID